MNIKLVKENFDKLLSESASKDNIYKVRDAINYTANQGLNNLNKLIDAIKSDGHSDVHSKLCSDLYTIGTAIDKLFSNQIDISALKFEHASSVGELLIEVSSINYELFCNSTESNLNTLFIDGKEYSDYLSVSMSGKITRVRVNV